MRRLYVCDAPAISHWLWHSKAQDAYGNELELAAKVTRWWDEFREKMKPSHFLCTFDGRNNWRKDEFAEYKIARLAKPSDPAKLAALKTMPGLWESFGVRTITHETFESDDCVATLCARWSDPETEIVIITSDKDLSMLVGQFDGQVSVYDPRPDRNGVCKFYDADAVYEKFGVHPHRLQEYLALVGDVSDSVPGVEGIGKAQAVVAIKQTKTAAEIFRKAAKHELANITPKNQDKIVAGREAFDLSLRLVSLRFDVPVELDINDCAIAAREVAA